MSAAAALRRRPWLWLGGAALALALALLALLPKADALLRDQLVRLLGAQLAMPVALEDARLEALAGQPQLHLRGLRLGPAQQAVVSIGGATLRSASLRAALAGRIEVIEAHAVELRLARDAGGRLNLAALRPPAAAPGADAAPLPEVRINDLRVILDPSLGAQGELRLAQLQAGSAQGSVRIAMKGALALAAPLAARTDFSATASLRSGAAPALESLVLNFVGAAQDGRADQGIIELARFAQSADGAWSLDGLGVAARIGSPALGSTWLALSVPAAKLARGRLTVPALGLAAHGRRDGVGYRGSLGLLDIAGSAWALRAGLARVTLAAELAGGSAFGLQLLGTLRSEDDLRVLRGDGLRLELSLPNPADGARPVALRGVADLGADLVGRNARFDFRGHLDASELEFEGDLEVAREPPLALRARVDRLDLDAYLGGDPAEAGKAAAWTRLPVALDLDVGQLRRQEVELRDVRLRYRPAAPQRRAE